LEIDGKTVGRISIPKGEDKPYYTVRNKYFIRVGSTKRIASREEMLRLFEASGAIHYDLVELDKAKISDLDIGQVAEYFTRYHISFLEESEEERQRLMLHADILGQNYKPKSYPGSLHGKPRVRGQTRPGIAYGLQRSKKAWNPC